MLVRRSKVLFICNSLHRATTATWIWSSWPRNMYLGRKGNNTEVIMITEHTTILRLSIKILLLTMLSSTWPPSMDPFSLDNTLFLSLLSCHSTCHRLSGWIAPTTSLTWSVEFCQNMTIKAKIKNFEEPSMSESLQKVQNRHWEGIFFSLHRCAAVVVAAIVVEQEWVSKPMLTTFEEGQHFISEVSSSLSSISKVLK